MLGDPAKFVVGLLAMVTTTLDEVLSACQQAHAVNGKLFNTVVAAMKIGMWLEVPLQRASVIARAYSFRTTGDETADKKSESDRASAISELTMLHTGPSAPRCTISARTAGPESFAEEVRAH
jgi:hypothetical protein